MSKIPATHRALICKAVGTPLEVREVNTPEVVCGSVLVRVLSASVSNSSKAQLGGKLPHVAPPAPFVPGHSGIGRVAAVGPDSTGLKIGQLVLTESYITSRDSPEFDQFIFGVFAPPGSRAEKLMKDVWRNAHWAEYVRVPLENCHSLNEEKLLGSPADGGLGYNAAILPYLARLLVPYGGLRSINLKAGETVIIAPATGGYSGAAVEVASAMGATVIAVGRNSQTLQRLAEYVPRVKTVQLTGDASKDADAMQKFGMADAMLDFTPSTVDSPTHMKGCMMCVKPYGRISLMGGPTGDLTVNYFSLMLRNITIRGNYMYDRSAVNGFIQLVESGLLRLGQGSGVENVGEFPLEEWQSAMNAAEEHSSWGEQVVFTL